MLHVVITGLGFELNSDYFFAKSHLEPDLAKNEAVSRIWGGGGGRILHANVGNQENPDFCKFALKSANFANFAFFQGFTCNHMYLHILTIQQCADTAEYWEN